MCFYRCVGTLICFIEWAYAIKRALDLWLTTRMAMSYCSKSGAAGPTLKHQYSIVTYADSPVPTLQYQNVLREKLHPTCCKQFLPKLKLRSILFRVFDSHTPLSGDIA